MQQVSDVVVSSETLEVPANDEIIEVPATDLDHIGGGQTAFLL